MPIPSKGWACNFTVAVCYSSPPPAVAAAIGLHLHEVWCHRRVVLFFLGASVRPEGVFIVAVHTAGSSIIDHFICSAVPFFLCVSCLTRDVGTRQGFLVSTCLLWGKPFFQVNVQYNKRK